MRKDVVSTYGMVLMMVDKTRFDENENTFFLVVLGNIEHSREKNYATVSLVKLP